MSILVAETHTKLLAKTHTFSYQFRKGGGKKGKTRLKTVDDRSEKRLIYKAYTSLLNIINEF